MRQRLSRYRPELGLLILTALLAWYCSANFRLETSIAELLPRATQPASLIADHLLDSELTRSMVLSIGPAKGRVDLPAAEQAATLSRSRRVAQSLSKKLEKTPQIAWVRSGPPANSEAAVYDLYFPSRHALLAPDSAALAEQLSPAALARAAADLKRELAGPNAPLVRKLATSDPLMAFKARLDALQDNGSDALTLSDNQFVSKDGHAILFVGLTDSALDGQKQGALLDQLGQLFRSEPEAAGLVLERSGFNLFSADSQRRIESDVNRVVACSVLCIACLFLYLFRSLLTLLLASTPLVFGLLAGLAACLTYFGEIHSLTLAFGVSLMGVCIDYPVHLLNHNGLQRTPDEAVFRGVRRGLVFGALTTVAGLSTLGFSGFSVMEQVAVFAAVGLLSSLAVTLYFLPRWDRSQASALRARLSSRLAAAAARTVQRPAPLVIGYTLFLTVGALGLAFSHWSSSMESLMPMSKALRAEDASVLSRIGAPGKGQFVVASAPTLEGALHANEALGAALELAVTQGELPSFQSMRDFLLSDEAQTRNLAALAADNTQQHIRDALTAADFNVDSFAPFFAAVSSPSKDAKLSYSALAASPLAPLVRRFVSQRENEFLIVTFLPDVALPASLRTTIKQLPGTHLVERKALVDVAYVRLQDKTRWMLLLAVATMGITVWLRTRRPGRTLAVLAPALAAPAFALGILGSSGQELNLFHVLSAIVVGGMALDYGIYTDEALASRQAVAASLAEDPLGGALLSISIAATTTLFSFGPLGFSGIPVLQAIGQTIGLGITTALLLVPVSISLGNAANQRAKSSP